MRVVPLLALLMLLVSCSTNDATALLVSVRWDVPGLQAIRVRVAREPLRASEGPIQDVTVAIGDEGLAQPLRLPVYAANADDPRPVRLTVEADPASPSRAFAVELLASFVPRAAIEIPVFLDHRCRAPALRLQCASAGRVCGAGGECVLPTALSLDPRTGLRDATALEVGVPRVDGPDAGAPDVIRDSASESPADVPSPLDAIDAPMDARPDAFDATTDTGTPTEPGPDGATDAANPSDASDSCSDCGCGERGQRCCGSTCGVGLVCATGTCQPAGGTCPAGYELVPDGDYVVGSDVSDPNRRANETPQWTASLGAFCMKRTEVTVGEFRACRSAARCLSDPATGLQFNWNASGRDGHPVNGVDWSQARDYCDWIGGRLPTEAEWEAAARGATWRLHPWGTTAPAPALANFNGTTGTQDVARVGYDRCDNLFGLCDMAGNVWEWVGDWLGTYPTGRVSNPTGPASGSERVLRGGAWSADAVSVRASQRGSASPGSRSDGVGFRCAVAAGCTPDAPCRPSNACRTGAQRCGTGSLVCMEIGSEPRGTACGVGLACDGAGTCGACGADGQPCCAGTCATNYACNAGTCRPQCPGGFSHVPAGDYLIGRDSTLDTHGSSSELPQFTAVLDAFCIQRREVSVDDFRACLLAGECGASPGTGGHCSWGRANGGALALNCVTYAQAARYCQWLGGRLPTEFEWEAAAHGPTWRLFPWGGLEPDNTLANSGYRNNDVQAPALAGLDRCRNPYGLCDMAGNLYEWTDTLYANYPTGRVVNPQGPASGGTRVARGGGWTSSRDDLRTTYRSDGWASPTTSSDLIGFRCVSAPR